MKLILLAAVAASAASSPRPLAPSERAVIENYVKSNLTDPYSARFKTSLIPSKTADAYCGYVNSKTPAGGYGGYAIFHVRLSRDPNGRITGARAMTIREADDPLGQYQVQQACAGAGYKL